MTAETEDSVPAIRRNCCISTFLSSLTILAQESSMKGALPWASCSPWRRLLVWPPLG